MLQSERGAALLTVLLLVAVMATIAATAMDRLVSMARSARHGMSTMPGAGRLTVAADADSGVVRIRISDTGAGMDAEALARAVRAVAEAVPGFALGVLFAAKQDGFVLNQYQDCFRLGEAGHPLLRRLRVVLLTVRGAHRRIGSQ